jgi:hypothetical protein
LQVFSIKSGRIHAKTPRELAYKTPGKFEYRKNPPKKSQLTEERQGSTFNSTILGEGQAAEEKATRGER